MAKVSIIVAVGKNREIGLNNALLWSIPEDLKHFKEKTTGKAIIMGERTFYSIGRALPNRLNIVLSQNSDLKIEGVTVCGSIPEAIEAGGKFSDEVFVIGGGSIYAQTIGLADKLYITLVDQAYSADVFFPEYNEYRLVKESETFNSNGLNYKFTQWERK
jgi:dihydrofolate reductase